MHFLTRYNWITVVLRSIIIYSCAMNAVADGIIVQSVKLEKQDATFSLDATFNIDLSILCNHLNKIKKDYIFNKKWISVC